MKKIGQINLKGQVPVEKKYRRNLIWVISPSCLFLFMISGCGPGTFLGTWADILSPNPSSDNQTKQPYSSESSVNGSSFKRTSQARRLNNMKRIKVYGIDNREWGVLGIPKNNAYNGFSVTAGDLNGDQIDDIIIGAPESEGILPQTTRSGWVYVILGQKNFPSKIDLKQQFDIGFWGGKKAGNNLLGHSLAVADFNGDGISDLAIGAPKGNGGPFQRIHSGEVYIVFGRKTFNKVIDLSKEADVTLVGAESGDRAGFSLATGDFNGDKVSDLVVGAPGGAGDQNRTPGSGETYLIYGRSRFPKGVDLSKNWNSRIFGVEGTDFKISLAEDKPDQSGFAVAAMDLNSDGWDDVVIGAPFANGFINKKPDAGESYVIFGKKILPQNIHLSHEADITLFGTSRGDQSGMSFYSGNLNGDALDDLLIGSPNAVRKTKRGSIQGLIHGIFGKKNHSKTVHLKSESDVVFMSDIHCGIIPYPNADLGTLSFGKSIVGLDLNHDGRDNLITGIPCSPGTGGKKSSGEIEFFPSGAERKWLNPSALFQPEEIPPQEYFGFTLAKGDVTGDGKTDILIGAPGMERSRKNNTSGGIYILPALADK